MTAFLEDMKRRGLNDPLLVARDGGRDFASCGKLPIVFIHPNGVRSACDLIYGADAIAGCSGHARIDPNKCRDQT